jgi:hypothetical protein
LLENPTSGYPLTLSWTFTISFEEVVRDYGAVSPELTIDWAPAGALGWRSMAGQRFSASTFADPIEASLYFFEHYRYDHAEVVVGDQHHGALQVGAVVSGDLDGLGVVELSARAWLRFEGIYVQSNETGTDPAAAGELLARFTTTDGLQPRPRAHNVVFEQTN